MSFLLSLLSEPTSLVDIAELRAENGRVNMPEMHSKRFVSSTVA